MSVAEYLGRLLDKAMSVPNPYIHSTFGTYSINMYQKETLVLVEHLDFTPNITQLLLLRL
jgi:hypothetical protein